MERIDKDEFVKIVLEEFPELQEDFVEWNDLLHLQMAAFSRLAQDAINKNDVETIKRCYKLASEILERANPDVENAVIVSFLENLEFENSINGTKAKNLLPQILKRALEELEDHFELLRKHRQSYETDATK